MAAPGPLRLAPAWDDRFGRMVGVSALVHALAIAAILVLGRTRASPLPLVAYTVELTDPSALGGRVPPGAPAPDLAVGAAEPAAPPPAAATPEVPAAPPEAKPEPKPEPPVEAKAERPSVEEPPKPAEVAPAPVEAKKPEPPKPPIARPEVPKPEPPKPAPARPPVSATPPKPAPAKPGTANPAAKEEPAPRDAYAAAAERWRSHAGGLGGSDTGSGPIGAGGSGAGGGGEVVGLEYVAYNQRIRDVIRSRWTSVVRRSGLVAYVYFRIAPDGQVSDVRIQQTSGDPAYDGSVLRAVQQANPLPPPPSRYVKQFGEVIVDLHSEEQGG